jgi:hypothetical protein
MSDSNTLIHNERTKLLANALDRASTGLGISTLLPLYSLARADSGHPAFYMGSAALFILAAIVLHILANRVLGRLK